MSRIHEALKKAELEKAENTTATADTQIPARPAPMPQTRTVVAEPPTPGQLAFESLAAGCRKSHWHGDPKKLFMLNPNQHGYGAEQLRTLRSRLYQVRDRMPLQTLLVTSALPGEGKTFVTANLAHAFVRQHERRILLIDADLRRSHLHEILGATNEPGLSDYLRGEADLNSVVQRGAMDNLFLISGGKTAQNPAELLASEKLKQLIDRMRPLFDWVIMDSPPVIPVSDPSLLADLCNGVLLVVRSGATPLDAILKVGQEMREKRLVGVVLNYMEEHNSASSGYYGYYGYYGYSSHATGAKPSKHGG